MGWGENWGENWKKGNRKKKEWGILEEQNLN
jgi:hypothetical protein